jgi:hypothetical protein
MNLFKLFVPVVILLLQTTEVLAAPSPLADPIEARM